MSTEFLPMENVYKLLIKITQNENVDIIGE